MTHDDLVSVRYIVNGVDEPNSFYTTQFDFALGQNASPGLRRGYARQN